MAQNVCGKPCCSLTRHTSDLCSCSRACCKLKRVSQLRKACSYCTPHSAANPAPPEARALLAMTHCAPQTIHPPCPMCAPAPIKTPIGPPGTAHVALSGVRERALARGARLARGAGVAVVVAAAGGAGRAHLRTDGGHRALPARHAGRGVGQWAVPAGDGARFSDISTGCTFECTSKEPGETVQVSALATQIDPN